jgi:thioesterase domain-containing protein
MGSVAFQFHVLAKRLRTRRQLLAIEVHDMDIAPSVLESLPDTAEAVVRRMRQVQPVGPYAFVGYSYGGNLAVEVARRLMNENQAVELVTVLDAYAPGSLRNPVRLNKVIRHLRILMRMKRHDAYAYISSKVRKRFGRGSDAAPDADLALAAPTSELERRLADTSERCSRAFDVYRPLPFPGRIVLVHATDLGDWMEVADPSGTCGWSAICTQGVDIIPIGCRHLDLFQEPHLTELAGHLDGLFDSLVT